MISDEGQMRAARIMMEAARSDKKNNTTTRTSNRTF